MEKILEKKKKLNKFTKKAKIQNKLSIINYYDKWASKFEYILVSVILSNSYKLLLNSPKIPIKISLF